MKEVLKETAKITKDVLLVGGATIVAGALSLWVKNKSKDTFNDTARTINLAKRKFRENFTK